MLIFQGGGVGKVNKELFRLLSFASYFFNIDMIEVIVPENNLLGPDSK